MKRRLVHNTAEGINSYELTWKLKGDEKHKQTPLLGRPQLRTRKGAQQGVSLTNQAVPYDAALTLRS